MSAYTSDLGDENERASGKFEGKTPKKALPPVTELFVQVIKQYCLLDRLKKNLIAYKKYLPSTFGYVRHFERW